jgi:hypothetical protein
MYIDTKDLPRQLQPLAGAFRAIQVEGRETSTMHADAGTWSGGTRKILSAVELETGRAVSITDTLSAPWNAGRTSREIALKPGFAILETGHLCGNPSQPRLFVHPQDLAPLLPAPEAAPLTEPERIWLYCVCCYISRARVEEAKRYRLTDAQINEARQSLFNRGYLSAAGAATTKGKNARPTDLPPCWGYVTPAPEPVETP